MNFGIILDKNGHIRSHRSLLKVALNPFLRVVGLQVATNYCFKTGKMLGAVLTTCPPRRNLLTNLKRSWWCPLYRGERLIKRRRLI